jgi:Type VI secretion system/phage-baseplate injector OB domain
MHFSLMEHIKRKDDLKYPQLGIVVSNDDPKKLGRVKVRIKNLLEGTIEQLPFVYCRMPTNTWGGQGQAIHVPKLESKLVVEFDYGDINFPAYTGYWSDKTNTPSHDDLTNLSSVFKADYPNVEGWEDTNGNYEAHNGTEKFIEYGYHSGYKRRIDKDGKLTDKALKEYIIEVLNKYQVDCNNILLGIGTGHKQLVTKDHLDTKYNALLQFLIPLYTTLASTSIDPASVVLAGALVSGLPNFIDTSSFTTETKAK